MSQRGGSRIAKFTREVLDPDQQALYDEIAFGVRSKGIQRFPLLDIDGALEGPFNAMLLAPKVGAALSQVGSAIRYSTSLSDRVREAAILMVAARWDCDFERRSHEPIAVDVGLTSEDIAAIFSGGLPAAETQAEATAFRIGALLVGEGDLDDDDFEQCLIDLGERAIFELSSLIGYYQTLALQLRIFRV
ncbi:MULTISPECIES: carboxymuconolactone decarboxylase family protein [Acidithrix]|uniref:Carboxymuconolactone decarboxylase family protein n=1 Tax=Acidithrix ferrooxidans TaxID=1280514 RepID=A0A0D8HF43_9ACTN|nr:MULTISPECIES: carboxymuconolactone decarboxylase family protein [Acidithrix]KJF16402.1 carboxymuconolactone decarboxylase family protein [Acidithrix ferrooxidans]CAG4929993.1 unnamed protein product [Acidithrix sp. C25]